MHTPANLSHSLDGPRLHHGLLCRVMVTAGSCDTDAALLTSVNRQLRRRLDLYLLEVLHILRPELLNKQREWGPALAKSVKD